MKKIAIIADREKDEAVEAAKEIQAWLRLKYSLLPSFSYNDQTDFAILLGGDGFITRKTLDLAKADIPFAAINFGTTGFLAVAEKDNWQEVLERVFAGSYIIEKRPLLTAFHFYGKNIKRLEAAGNVYLRHVADMILVSVSIDGKVIYKEMRCDGVIVANAIGATAYNLSAGGAIISSGLVITPICPHALNVKSLPVPEFSKTIEIIYHGRKSSYTNDEGCLLFVDSDKYPVSPGDRVVVGKSKDEAYFIIPEGFSFIESLQKKLGLSR